MLGVESNPMTRPPRWPLVIMAALVGLVVAALVYRSTVSRPDTSAVSVEGIELEDVSSAKVLDLVKQSGRVSLVNIWATWCQPCIEEFPFLLELRRKFPDLNLVLVSADVEEDRSRVLEFLGEQGVDFKTYIKAEADNEFVSRLSPNWTGALPATFIYNKNGELKDFWMGDASLEEFSNAVERVMEIKE